MRKNIIAKYSTILLATMLIIGCQTAERESEKIGKIVQPGDGTPNSGGDFINDNNNSNGGSVANDDDNATTGTIQIDAKNAYKVSVKFSDDYNQKGYYSREEIGKISFELTNIYTNEPANTSIIDNITLEAEEQNSPTDGKYLNFITYTGEQGPKYSIPKESVKASDSVAIKMKDLSGTTNIILTASIILKDGEATSDYKLKVPIVIEKNKSSSMAIVPMDSRYENGLFIDKFVIHVVDSYGNKAKDGTNISTGVINNPKLYSNAFNNITYDENDENTLYSIIRNPKSLPNVFYEDTGSFNKNENTFTLSPNNIDPSKNIITEQDTLILLANKDQYKPENLGGWDIESISDDKVSIIDYDTDTPIASSYVIGSEYRYDECSQTLMNAAASTFEITEVKDGLAYAELRYVPAMIGKSVFIYANSRLENKRIGISRKVTLSGLGLTTQTLSCNYENTGSNCSINFKMMINGANNIPAQNVYLEQPLLAGPAVYNYATASKTDCDGWTTISIHGIDVNKTATVKFGEYISDELIKNKK